MSIWSRLAAPFRRRQSQRAWVETQVARLESVRADIVTQLATRQRADGFYNATTGLGVEGIDRSLNTFFYRGRTIDLQELDAMYHEHWLFRRIVEKLPTEAMRQGYEIAILEKDKESRRRPEVNSDQSMAINATHKALGVREKFLRAAIFGRSKGASLVVMGIDDKEKDIALPVREDAIAGIRYLDVHERPWFRIHKRYEDPLAPKHGEPEVYEVHRRSRGSFKVHESRCILFGGARTGSDRKLENDGFDLSVLQAPWDTIKAHGTVWSLATMMLEANGVGILKVTALPGIMANAAGAASLEDRIAEIDYALTALKTLALKTGEDYERKGVPLAGLKDMLEIEMSQVSAACDMDDAELWGVMPSGLTVTPEHVRGRYDRTGAYQTHELQPAIERITRLMFLSSEGPTARKVPDSWEVRFPSLWQETQKECAETRKLTAEADAIEIAQRVVTAEEVAVMRHGPEMSDPVDLTRRYAAIEGQAAADPGAQPEGETAPEAEEVKPEDDEAVDPTTALNGAQVSALLEIVASVAEGRLPRETGVAMITACFPLSAAQADKVMGPVGRGFEAPPKQVPPPFGGNGSGPPKPDEEPDEEEETA